jgi:hypothetical protein
MVSQGPQSRTSATSPVMLAAVFSVQLFLIGGALYSVISISEWPFLINARDGDVTVRLSLFVICALSFIYSIVAYHSIQSPTRYPDISNRSRVLSYSLFISVCVTIFFCVCTLSSTYDLQKFLRSLSAILDPDRWDEYRNVDPWPTVALVGFSFATSTCLTISNIIVALKSDNQSQRDQLGLYLFHLHLGLAAIALIYGIFLYGTNEELFRSKTGYYFILPYILSIFLYMVLVFIYPAIRYDIIKHSKLLYSRIVALSAPGWVLAIHAFLVANFPEYKKVTELLGLVYSNSPQ